MLPVINTCYLLPVTCYLLLVTCYLLPVTYYLLLVTCYLLLSIIKTLHGFLHIFHNFLLIPETRTSTLFSSLVASLSFHIGTYSIIVDLEITCQDFREEASRESIHERYSVSPSCLGWFMPDIKQKSRYPPRPRDLASLFYESRPVFYF